jgi:hypothetical protein
MSTENTYISGCHFHVHGESNATFSSLAGNSALVIYFANFASYIWKRICKVTGTRDQIA